MVLTAENAPNTHSRNSPAPSQRNKDLAKELQSAQTNLYPLKTINQKRHRLLAPAWLLDPATDAGCWGAMLSVSRQAAISESHHEESEKETQTDGERGGEGSR